MVSVMGEDRKKVWLVCGGRDFNDRAAVFGALDDFLGAFGEPDFIVTGGAAGADSLALAWACERKIPRKSCPANWVKYKRAAGSIRNQEMLDEFRPDVVVAFRGGVGTANMVRRARKVGVPVFEVKPTTT